VNAKETALLGALGYQHERLVGRAFEVGAFKSKLDGTDHLGF
jgi:hypothetical protein